ncbi:MAG: UDP-N-acetylglucosamine 2-epimerase (non-hydrolyzing) [Ignavibacteriae bacterium]|nr:UDP-N-acetylglucosamine 2-epimerase (non-hydrolyzing) [Ignavibacteriota bacterium]
MKISFIVGTRPELIKVAPLIIQFKKTNIEVDIVNTAQHKDLLDPYWNTFGLEPTHILNVMIPNQSLSALTSRSLNEIQTYIDTVNVRPDIILAQGDTTTVMAASMICFYNQIKFAHLEAGLRSFDIYSPYPEELNRRIASLIADFHFCPTSISKHNLINEGIPNEKIFEVGNTVVDTLEWIRANKNMNNIPYQNKALEKISSFKKSVLVTCHRRENQGQNLLNIIDAIQKLAIRNPETIFVWAIHPNPRVKGIVSSSSLKNLKNILFTEPLEYLDVLCLMSRSFCVISDSGGIQEEAPSFKIPVIVLRETTERPEGVDMGLAFLAGADSEKILYYYKYIEQNSITFSINPYGDGASCQRIEKIILKEFMQHDLNE